MPPGPSMRPWASRTRSPPGRSVSAIRRLNAWDKEALVAALLDERRSRTALRLTDEAWALAGGRSADRGPAARDKLSGP